MALLILKTQLTLKQTSQVSLLQWKKNEGEIQLMSNSMVISNEKSGEKEENKEVMVAEH